jgi:preprotein translocase subunit SecF
MTGVEITSRGAPPPNAAVAGDGEIPGYTRRHTFSDLYHEHTNYRFIEHSRRWLLLSTVLILLSVGALVVRQLNLGIEFEGGTAWQVTMADGRDASTSEVRDLVGPLGFPDAKVSTLSGQSGDSVRVQAEVVEDPIRTIQGTIADAAGLEPAAVQFVRNGAGVAEPTGAEAEPEATGGDGAGVPEPTGEEVPTGGEAQPEATGAHLGGTFTVTVPSGETVTQEELEAALAESGQSGGEVVVEGQSVTVHFAELPSSPLQEVADALAEYAGVDVSEVSVSTVGPTWGETVSEKALQALIIFFLLLAVYLAFRFEWKMSVTAIVAVLHDIIVSVGVYALFQFEVTPATVTAFLTILGFSLYDTVVVYDKIKENQRTLTATGRSTYPEMVNRSLNAVLMRSLSTSVVALLPVLSLLIVGSLMLGATALEEFALALAVGLGVGSYSSLFVAAPLLAAWKDREPQYRALSERRRRTTLAAASVATGVPVVEEDEPEEPRVKAVAEGIPGPPAVGRTATAHKAPPRGRQQRGRKRR